MQVNQKLFFENLFLIGKTFDKPLIFNIAAMRFYASKVL
jgi:hypothetical protein